MEAIIWNDGTITRQTESGKIETVKLSASAKRMVKKYGIGLCIEAFKLYGGGLMGGGGVGYTLGVKTNTADALIFAGGELLENSIFDR